MKAPADGAGIAIFGKRDGFGAVEAPGLAPGTLDHESGTFGRPASGDGDPGELKRRNVDAREFAHLDADFLHARDAVGLCRALDDLNDALGNAHFMHLRSFLRPEA